MSSTRVLIVDDDRNVADSLAVILNQNGFEAVAAYSGADAIRHALESPPEFIVMDVVMKEIDGVDAAIAICETLPHCRILLISGELQAQPLLGKASIRGHHFELLMKPVEPALLMNRLRPETELHMVAA